MITSVELRKALSTMLKTNFQGWRVHFDRVENADASYIYVEIMPARKTVDRTYYDRSIAIDIIFVPLQNASGRIHHAELYDAIDKLDSVIRPVFQIGDRYITVLNTSSHIVDDVLHYEFSLDFTDYMPDEPVDLMEELNIGFSIEEE